MSTRVTVKCPRCEDSISASVRVDPGEPMVRYYPDGSGYPGSGPTIEDIEDIDYECGCKDEADREGSGESYTAEVEALIYDCTDFEYDPSDYEPEYEPDDYEPPWGD